MKKIELLESFIEENPQDLKGWRGFWLGVCASTNLRLNVVQQGSDIIDEAAAKAALKDEAEQIEQQVKMLRLSDRNVFSENPDEYWPIDRQFNFISKNNKSVRVVDIKVVSSNFEGLPSVSMFIAYTGVIEIFPNTEIKETVK